MPTIDIDKPIADPVSRTQVETLRRNCEEFGIRLHPMGDLEQGIVHIIGPQLGLTSRDDGRLRGQSHVHPRRIRFARDGHRHVGG